MLSVAAVTLFSASGPSLCRFRGRPTGRFKGGVAVSGGGGGGGHGLGRIGRRGPGLKKSLIVLVVAILRRPVKISYV